MQKTVGYSLSEFIFVAQSGSPGCIRVVFVNLQIMRLHKMTPHVIAPMPKPTPNQINFELSLIHVHAVIMRYVQDLLIRW